jgi:hypothetical protein
MPYPSTIPHIYDECKTISMSDLNRWGMMTEGWLKSEIIKWSRNGIKTSSIAISVNYLDENPFITLKYTYRDEPIDYKVYFTSVASNIGKGRVWYFRCSFTSKRCRKLYLAAGRFAHRSRSTGYYDSQVQSRRNRSLIQIHSLYQKQEDAYSEIYSKGFRTTYNGKPTRRYTKLLKCINIQPVMSLEQLYLM